MVHHADSSDNKFMTSPSSPSHFRIWCGGAYQCGHQSPPQHQIFRTTLQSSLPPLHWVWVHFQYDWWRSELSACFCLFQYDSWRSELSSRFSLWEKWCSQLDTQDLFMQEAPIRKSLICNRLMTGSDVLVETGCIRWFRQHHQSQSTGTVTHDAGIGLWVCWSDLGEQALRFRSWLG